MTPTNSATNAQVITESIEAFFTASADTNAQHVGAALCLIDAAKLPDIEIYLQRKESGTTRYELFRKRGLYLSPREITSLKDNGTNQVFILKQDVPVFVSYLETILASLPPTSILVDEKKIKLLRESAIQTMQQIFESPSVENIERGRKAVSSFVYLLMKDPKAYQMLLLLSSHDPYTLQHSVGTATHAIILAKKSGIQDEAELIETGLAGLLHDIGKTKVPKEIINKPGALDAHEWEVMKKHPGFAYEILKDNPNVSTKTKLAILSHHEENGGAGYPLGLTSDQISIPAKIVCLTDIFNAITTDRPYSKAKTAFEALELVRAKMMNKVDPKLFEALVLIYGRKV